MGALERALVALAGPDAYGALDRVHEDLAVADVPGLRRGRDHDLDHHLGQEVHGVLTAAVQLGVAFLAAEAADLGDGHADDPDPRERLLHVVELERLDDRFDFFHGLLPRRLLPPPRRAPLSNARA